jgi:multiple sugar transport system permease protein
MGRGSSRSAWSFLAFPMAVIVMFTALPMAAGIGLSFFEWDGGGAPRWVGLLNYTTALRHDTQLHLALRNTTIFAAVTVPATVVLAFMIAAALEARWFRGAVLARTLYFVPTVMSIVAVGFVWQWMLNPRSGLVQAVVGSALGERPDWLGDSWLGLSALMLVHVWRNLGFGVVLYTAALASVSRTMRDAARMDGAGPWRGTWLITWPAVRPMTAFLLVSGAIWALQVFDLDIVMTGPSPQRWNDVLNTHVFREFQNGRLGYAATVGVVVLVISALVTWAQLRWMRPSEGLAR